MDALPDALQCYFDLLPHRGIPRGLLGRGRPDGALPAQPHLDGDCRGVVVIMMPRDGGEYFNEIKRLIGGISQRMLTHVAWTAARRIVGSLYAGGTHRADPERRMIPAKGRASGKGLTNQARYRRWELRVVLKWRAQARL